MEEYAEANPQPEFKVGDEVVISGANDFGYDTEGYGETNMDYTGDFEYPVEDEDKLEIVSIDWQPGGAPGYIYNLENNEGWRVWNVPEVDLYFS